MLSESERSQILSEVSKYPEGHARAAVMAALRIGQEKRGWVSPELMESVAEMLDIEPIKVAEVATFYTMYDLAPIGRHKVSVCTNISCALRGSRKLVEHITSTLKIGFGETTEDGKVTLKEVECLAACGGAPVLLIDEEYHENVTPQRFDEILESLP